MIFNKYLFFLYFNIKMNILHEKKLINLLPIFKKEVLFMSSNNSSLELGKLIENKIRSYKTLNM